MTDNAPPVPGIPDETALQTGLAARLHLITEELESQVSRLSSIRKPGATERELDLLRAGVADISSLIARTRSEVAGLTPLSREQTSRLTAASGELDSVVGATEQAAVQILMWAEQSRDAGIRLRESGELSPAAQREVDLIERAAGEIFTACSFQDLTGQRIRKVVTALTYVEMRVKSLAEQWTAGVALAFPSAESDSRPDAHLLHGPSEDGLAQTDVDSLFGGGAPRGVASQSEIDSLFS